MFCKERAHQLLSSSSIGLIVLATLLIFFFVLLITVGLTYFFYYRKEHIMLEKRNLPLLMVMVIGGLCLIANGTIRVFVGADKYPCRLFFFFGNIGYQMLCYTFVARISSLYWRVSFNQKLIKYKYSAILNGEIDLSPNPGFTELDRDEVNYTNSYYDSVLKSDKDIVKSSNCFNTFIEKSVTSRLKSFLFSILCWKTRSDLNEELQLPFLLASKRFAIIFWLFLMSVVTGLTLALLFISFPLGQNCKGCSLKESFEFSNLPIFFGLFVACIYLFVLFKLRKYPDSLGIKRELIVSALILVAYFFLVGVPLALRSKVFETLEIEGKFHLTIVEGFVLLVLLFYAIPYQVIRARQRKPKANLTQDFVTLLASKDGRRAFIVYLVSNLSFETLSFYEAVNKWKSDYASSSIESRSEEAELILKTYIEEEAFLLINISFNTRNDIFLSMADNVALNMFDIAQRAVFEQMTSDIFPRFLKTPFYKAYQNEIQYDVV